MRLFLFLLATVVTGQTLPRFGEYLRGDAMAVLGKKYGKPVREEAEWRFPRTAEGWEIRVRGKGKRQVIEVSLPEGVKKQALRDAYGEPREGTFLRVDCPGGPMIESHPDFDGEIDWHFANEKLYALVQEKPMRLIFQSTPITRRDNPCAKPLLLGRYLNRNSLTELEKRFGKRIYEGLPPEAEDDREWMIRFPLLPDGSMLSAFGHQGSVRVEEIWLEYNTWPGVIHPLILNYGWPKRIQQFQMQHCEGTPEHKVILVPAKPDLNSGQMWFYPQFRMEASPNPLYLRFTTKPFQTSTCPPAAENQPQ